MICYRDRSYCLMNHACATTPCPDRLSDHDRLRALQMGLPVAWMDFSSMCGKFVPKESKSDCSISTGDTL